jgi:hypothetical protein
MERDVLAGGQPVGLAAAPQNTTDPHSETLCIKNFLGGGASALWALAPPYEGAPAHRAGAPIPSSH